MDWLTVILPSTKSDNDDSSVTLTGVKLSKNKDGRLVVVAVDRKLQEHEHALADLMLGMEILKINNIDAPRLGVLEEDHLLTSTRTRLTGVKEAGNSRLLTLIVRPPTLSTNGLIVHAIYKPAVDTKVGIAFWQSDPQVDTGYVLIDRIVHSPCKSVAAEHLLKPGMRILSINNQLQYNCRETAELVRNSVGLLTLLVQVPQDTRPLYDPVTATFPLFIFETYKQSGTQELGLSLELVDGKIVIAELSKVFRNIKNELRVGMELLSINNVTVETPEMAQALLLGAIACAGVAPGTTDEESKQQNVLIILAQQIMDPPPGTLVSVSVTKPANDSKLGIIQGMQMPQVLNRLPKDYSNHGHVVIRRITEGGLISQRSGDSVYKLQPGMMVHQITIQGKSTRIRGMQNKQVSALLRTAGRGSTVTFLAEVPTSAPFGVLCPKTVLSPPILDKLDTVALTKKIPNQSIGMTLSKPDGSPQIMVQKVEEGGLAAISGIKVGMQIIKVNNSHVRTVVDVVNGISNAPINTPVSLLVLTDAASFIPPVVTGSVYKETKGSKVGIKLRKYKGGSAIVSIKEDSISSSTDLLGGLLIQSINNVQGQAVTDTEQAANLLIDGQGDITILAVTPEEGVVESSPFVTATVLLTKDTALQEDAFTYEEGRVWISQAGMKGLFAGSSLRVGMEVITLNNVDCSLMAKPEGIMSMMEPTSDERCVVTILAKKAALPPASALVTATVVKESPESKIGLTYVVDNARKKTVVTRIDNGALAATESIKPGMEILTINNSPVPGLEREEVGKLFAEATGVCHIVGVTAEGKRAKDDRILIAILLDKTDHPGAVGIKVIRDHYDNAVISEIKEDSLAASSDIIPGLILRCIDNVSCDGKAATDVMAMLEASIGHVTLLAEANPHIGKLVTATLCKATPETKLGVTMIQRNKRVLVKKLVPDSLTEASDLEIGMWIKQINNQDVSKASVMYCAKVLGRENPVVTVLAETTTETFDEEEEAKQEEEEDVASTPDPRDEYSEHDEGVDELQAELASLDRGEDPLQVTATTSNQDNKEEVNETETKQEEKESEGKEESAEEKDAASTASGEMEELSLHDTED